MIPSLLLPTPNTCIPYPNDDLFSVIFPARDGNKTGGKSGERKAATGMSVSSTAKEGFIGLFMGRINGSVTRIYIPLVSWFTDFHLLATRVSLSRFPFFLLSSAYITMRFSLASWLLFQYIYREAALPPERRIILRIAYDRTANAARSCFRKYLHFAATFRFARQRKWLCYFRLVLSDVSFARVVIRIFLSYIARVCVCVSITKSLFCAVIVYNY